MHDFRCKKASEMNYDTLADRVRYFKEDEGGRETMCKLVEDLREEARAETRKEDHNLFAIRLLELGELSIEKIAKVTGFSIGEIEKIKKDLDKKKS